MQVEFDINKHRAIKTIIEYQNGKNLLPAIRELIQNSLDAGATKIDITIKGYAIRVKDNGIGMNKEVINKNFRILFEAEKGEDQIGQFGIGRTQIINFGPTIWRTLDSSIFVDIQEFLGFNLKHCHTTIKGTDVVCYLANPIVRSWEVSSLRNKINSIVLPINVEITINNQPISPEIYYYEEFCTSDFDIFKSSNAQNVIYNKGIKVKEFVSNFNYCVNCKKKLRVNFARNEFMDEDEDVKDLQGKMREVEALMTERKTTFSKEECSKMLTLINDGSLLIDDNLNRAIVYGARNRFYSFNNLANKEIMFGVNDIWSKDCIDQGKIVINSDIKTKVCSIIRTHKLNITISTVNPKDISRRGYYKDSSVDKLRRNKLYGYIPEIMNRQIFLEWIKSYEDKKDEDIDMQPRKVKLGESDLINSWTDGHRKIWIDNDVIESFKSTEEAIFKIYMIIAHEYCHYTNTIEDDDHTWSYGGKLQKILKETADYYINFRKEVDLKYIKALYIGE